MAYINQGLCEKCGAGLNPESEVCTECGGPQEMVNKHCANPKCVNHNIIPYAKDNVFCCKCGTDMLVAG